MEKQTKDIYNKKVKNNINKPQTVIKKVKEAKKKKWPIY